MYSLIISVASVALVAALSLATLYYGGVIWAAQQSTALAAALASHGAQYRASLLLYGEEHASSYPAALSQLVPLYMQALPAPPADMFRGTAHTPAVTDWAPAGDAGIGVWMHGLVRAEICDMFNLRVAYSNPGIPKWIDGTRQAQCFHDPGETDPDVNTVLVLTAAPPAAVCAMAQSQGIPCSVTQGALPVSATPAMSPPSSCGDVAPSGWYEPVCRNPVLFGT